MTLTDAKWAKQIAAELRYMRKVIKDDWNECTCFTSPEITGLNSRVHGILDTAVMLLERYPDK